MWLAAMTLKIRNSHFNIFLFRKPPVASCTEPLYFFIDNQFSKIPETIFLDLELDLGSQIFHGASTVLTIIKGSPREHGCAFSFS